MAGHIVREPLGAAPELLTSRTRMRRHRAEDFDAMARIWGDESVVRYISGWPSTPAETWSRLLRYIGHWHALGFGYWAVEDRRTGEFLGEVGFAEYKRDIQPPLDGAPEAGWVLAPHAQGKGIATEAMAAALQWPTPILSETTRFASSTRNMPDPSAWRKSVAMFKATLLPSRTGRRW